MIINIERPGYKGIALAKIRKFGNSKYILYRRNEEVINCGCEIKSEWIKID